MSDHKDLQQAIAKAYEHERAQFESLLDAAQSVAPKAATREFTFERYVLMRLGQMEVALKGQGTV